MQTRRFDEVLTGYGIDDIDVTDMLDDGSYGHGNHKQYGFPGYFGKCELRKAEPGGIAYGFEVNFEEQQGCDVAGNDSAEYGNKAQQSFCLNGNENGGNKGNEGYYPIGFSHRNSCFGQ